MRAKVHEDQQTTEEPLVHTLTKTMSIYYIGDCVFTQLPRQLALGVGHRS